jgi:hypothetical protein
LATASAEAKPATPPPAIWKTWFFMFATWHEMTRCSCGGLMLAAQAVWL